MIVLTGSLPVDTAVSGRKPISSAHRCLRWGGTEVITPADLARLTIERAIVHGIPKKLRGGEDQGAELSQVDSPLDADTVKHFQRKMVQTIGGKSAYELVFLDKTASPVPPFVRDYTKKKNPPADMFIDSSQRLAHYLFEQQLGSSSAGLLCVLGCRVSDTSAVAILKVEREAGARLTPTIIGGKKTFEIGLVQDLMLPSATKLFKNALFLRGAGEEFAITACDTQRSTTNLEIARFWARFLGCEVKEEPRVATKRFYEINMQYIRESVKDPIAMNTWAEHTVSELKSNKKVISPRKFIEDYVPEAHRQPFEDFLQQKRFPLRQFGLNTLDISRKLAMRAYHTSRGAKVVVPADAADILTIERERIIVSDSLSSID